MAHKQNIHLVFGATADAVLSQSGLIHPEKDDKLVLSDPLTLGPLIEVTNEQGIENRQRWLAEHVDGSITMQNHLDFVREDCDGIKKLVANVAQYEAIYLWLGEDSNEKIAMARLLHLLRGIQVPVFKPDFSKVAVKNIRGETIHPGTLYMMNAADLPEVARHIYELDTREREFWPSLWEQLWSNDSESRIFDKSDNIVSGDRRFFDRFLLAVCSDEPQSSARIVGQALAAIWDTYGMPGVGDVFLFHRLNRLGAEGTLEITERNDEPHRKHLFKVRKAVSRP